MALGESSCKALASLDIIYRVIKDTGNERIPHNFADNLESGYKGNATLEKAPEGPPKSGQRNFLVNRAKQRNAQFDFVP